MATTGEVQTGLNDHPPLIIIERYFLVNPSETGFNGELANQEPEKEKTRAGKVLSGLFKSAQSVFTKRLDEIDDRRPARFNIWNLASKGVESYNALTDNDVAFYQRINDEGKTVSVGLDGDDFHYQKDFNKE